MHSRHRFAIAFVLALAAAALPQSKLTLNLQVGGKTRNCIAHVPAGISKPPLVFFIHGANGSGGAFENETRGDATADREKFIAAYPSASGNGATGTWDDMSGTGNFPFFMAVIDTLDALYHIDRDRIYMTGFSQGGFISFAAACFYSDVFAAVAPVSGHSNTSCTIKRPVPMFMTFGAKEGASSFLKDLDVWLKLDKCPSAQTITRPYPASNPNSKAVRVGYGPCSEGTAVLMDSIIGQAHQWPSSSNLVQADEVWAFFKQYSLASATGIARPGLPLSAREPEITAAYASGFLRLEGIPRNARVAVKDVRGKAVAEAVPSGNGFRFQGDPNTLYLIQIRDQDRIYTKKIAAP